MSKFHHKNTARVNAVKIATLNAPSGLVIFEALSVPAGGSLDLIINNSFIPVPSVENQELIIKPNLEFFYTPNDAESLYPMITNWTSGSWGVRLCNPTAQDASADKVFMFRIDSSQI